MTTAPHPAVDAFSEDHGSPHPSQPPQGHFTEAELLAVIEQERSSRVNLEQTLEAERQSMHEHSAAWQQQLADANERLSLHEELSEAQDRDREAAEQESAALQEQLQVAQHQLQVTQQQLQDVASQPAAPAPAPAPVFEEPSYDEPASSRGSSGLWVGLALLTIVASVGAYVGYVMPRVADAERTAKSVEAEKRVLEARLADQEITANRQVSTLKQELESVRKAAAAAAAAAKAKPAAARPAAAKWAKRRPRRGKRRPQRAAVSRNSKDPIAGIDGL